MQLRAEGGHASLAVATAVPNRSKNEGAEVVFNKYASEYFLPKCDGAPLKLRAV